MSGPKHWTLAEGRHWQGYSEFIAGCSQWRPQASHGHTDLRMFPPNKHGVQYLAPAIVLLWDATLYMTWVWGASVHTRTRRLTRLVASSAAFSYFLDPLYVLITNGTCGIDRVQESPDWIRTTFFDGVGEWPKVCIWHGQRTHISTWRPKVMPILCAPLPSCVYRCRCRSDGNFHERPYNEKMSKKRAPEKNDEPPNEPPMSPPLKK